MICIYAEVMQLTREPETTALDIANAAAHRSTESFLHQCRLKCISVLVAAVLALLGAIGCLFLLLWSPAFMDPLQRQIAAVFTVVNMALVLLAMLRSLPRAWESYDMAIELRQVLEGVDRRLAH